MNMFCQIFVLAILIGIVYAIAYHRGKNSKEREEEPTFNKTKLENDNPEYRQFYRLFDEMMTNDDFFSDDIAKSSPTDTNKNKLK